LENLPPSSHLGTHPFSLVLPCPLSSFRLDQIDLQLSLGTVVYLDDLIVFFEESLMMAFSSTVLLAELPTTQDLIATGATLFFLTSFTLAISLFVLQENQ
jgi:hypothetical protein